MLPFLGAALRCAAATLAVGALAAPPAVAADSARAPRAEVALAEKYAPVVALVHQDEECGPGEPYLPTDVTAVLGQDSVALRGPWDAADLVEVAPTAEDLAGGLAGYYLDFPGNPLDPGCDYETWARTVSAGTRPTIYAHVAAEPGRPGRIALQYWLYYLFNDYNNKHEGDWEMIQLEFPAADAAAALEVEPDLVGYSQHSGAEQAAWGDAKLERVDGTHPVVHVAAGSHANYYAEELYLGRSAQEGFGCDDTRGPVDEVRPSVTVIPQDEALAEQLLPWVGYLGLWGQKELSFYSGPDGPAAKTQWSAPFTWSREQGRDASFAVPGSGLFGTAATDTFCGGVADGAEVWRAANNNPGAAVLLLALLALLVTWLVRRTTWVPAAPLRLAHRRAWGQVLAAAARAYAARPGLFLGIGALSVPATVLAALVEQGGSDPGGGEAAGTPLDVAGTLAALVVYVVTLVLVQAASIRSMVEVDAGREVGLRRALGLALGAWRPLLVTTLLWLVLVGGTAASVVLAPLSVVVVVLAGLFVPVVVVEGLSPLRALLRSARLVWRRPVKVTVLIGVANAVAAGLGPVLGTLLILATGLPFAVTNLVAGLTAAVLVPYVAVVTTYVYFDARVAHEARAATARPAQELPEEITWS